MELRTERVSRCRFFKLIFLDPCPFIIMRCRPCEKFAWGQRKTFRNRKGRLTLVGVRVVMFRLMGVPSPRRSRRKLGRFEFSDHDWLTSCFLAKANVAIATKMRAIERDPCMSNVSQRRCFCERHNFEPSKISYFTGGHTMTVTLGP
jgi:hypothetical protein